MEYRRALDFIKDILFPKFCVKCNQESNFCCKECLEKICKEIKKFNLIEIDFRLKKFEDRVVYLDKLTALFDYKKKKELQKLIHMFKYEYCEEISEVWQNLFSNCLKFDFLPDLIIPIPLHSRRKRERGFNQSEVLANILVEEFKKRGEDIKLNTIDLKRVRYTVKQINLGNIGRQENLKNAFKWTGDSLLGKTVLLIDDVYTTGATLNESAKILKNNGADRVDCIVLAKD